MREKFAIIFAIILVCGLCRAARLCQAQKPRKEDVHESIRLELERFRGLYQSEHEHWAKEYDQRKAAEFQLSQLRAAVAKAAKL